MVGIGFGSTWLATGLGAPSIDEIESASWIVWSLFMFAFGASLGSFMNVIAWRLPRGGSVVSPPSRCPTCAGRLTWRENLPVLGWILLRGRCRFCGTRIGVQYLLIELLLGGLFVAAFLMLYLPDRGDWWTLGTGDWWIDRQFAASWPGLLALLMLFSLLVPITLIDARTFLIPLSLTLWITGLAAVLWTLQATLALPWQVPLDSAPTPLPELSAESAGAALGGVVGVLALAGLLRGGVVTPSFADYDAFVEEGETLGEYPHGRREVFRELLHLTPVIAGVALGAWIGGLLADGSAMPAWLQALSSVAMGYLTGAGLVWGVRILGTFAFGREAMGLGDVHLLAAIGATLGWIDAVAVFFLAPFLGLAWALVAAIMGTGVFGDRLSHLGSRVRTMPYGPHLAVAAVLVVLLRPVLVEVWQVLVPSSVPLEFALRFTASPTGVSMLLGR